LHISIGKVPLIKQSNAPTIKPAIGPDIELTFDAPMLLYPDSNGDTFFVYLTRRYPVGIPPKKYADIARIKSINMGWVGLVDF